MSEYQNQNARLKYGLEEISEDLLPSKPGELQPEELERLWELFQQIGRTWDNVPEDSAGQRSSWLEFVTLRCATKPSYLAEYRNALKVLAELEKKHGLVEGYRRLFFDTDLTSKPKGAVKITRLRHAKLFVVDEFIRVQIVAGGFRGFGGKQRAYNYNGFLRGTRYNRVQRVRTYRPKKNGPAKRGKR